jgi:hypothetical protein
MLVSSCPLRQLFILLTPALHLTEAYRKAGAVKLVVKRLLSRDFDKLEEATAPEAFVYVQSPAELPYSGRFRGKDCVRKFMNKFNESFVIKSVPEVYNYINESGSVFVAFDFELQATQNPEVTFTTSMTMKIKVDDELRLTKIAVISDTLNAYQALQMSTSQ